MSVATSGLNRAAVGRVRGALILGTEAVRGMWYRPSKLGEGGRSYI